MTGFLGCKNKTTPMAGWFYSVCGRLDDLDLLDRVLFDFGKADGKYTVL